MPKPIIIEVLKNINRTKAFCRSVLLTKVSQRETNTKPDICVAIYQERIFKKRPSLYSVQAPSFCAHGILEQRWNLLLRYQLENFHRQYLGSALGRGGQPLYDYLLSPCGRLQARVSWNHTLLSPKEIRLDLDGYDFDYCAPGRTKLWVIFVLIEFLFYLTLMNLTEVQVVQESGWCLR